MGGGVSSPASEDEAGKPFIQRQRVRTLSSSGCRSPPARPPKPPDGGKASIVHRWTRTPLGFNLAAVKAAGGRPGFCNHSSDFSFDLSPSLPVNRSGHGDLHTPQVENRASSKRTTVFHVGRGLLFETQSGSNAALHSGLFSADLRVEVWQTSGISPQVGSSAPPPVEDLGGRVRSSPSACSPEGATAILPLMTDVSTDFFGLRLHPELSRISSVTIIPGGDSSRQLCVQLKAEIHNLPQV